jgi:hypothetical protein
MRFVLLGVSVAIAWLAWWKCDAAPTISQKDDSSSTDAKKASSWWQQGGTVVDMMSGRYIYNYVRSRGARPQAL